MAVLLPIVGLLPFAVGGLLNWLMLSYPSFTPPFILIAIVFLCLWGGAAYILKRTTMHTAVLVCLMNLPAFVVLILLGVQELILHSYWLNFVGLWTQYFYLPTLTIGYKLTAFSSSVFAAYCASFVLMVAVSAIGCKLRKSPSAH